MNELKVTPPAVVALLSGAALLLVYFLLDFYGATLSFRGQEVDTGVEAAGAFDVIDVILILVALAAIGFAVLSVLGLLPENAKRQLAIAVTAVGAVAAVLLLFRIVDLPNEITDENGNKGSIDDAREEAEERGGELDVGPDAGIWLALLASAGIAAGGYLAMREAGGAPGRGFPQGPASPTSPPPAPGPPPGSGPPPPAAPPAG